MSVISWQNWKKIEDGCQKKKNTNKWVVVNGLSRWLEILIYQYYFGRGMWIQHSGDGQSVGKYQHTI